MISNLSTIENYIKLLRVNDLGFLVVFFPCAFVIASFKIDMQYYFILFLLGSLIMTSAGCIINDILDRSIDKHVSRTKSRPLVTKRISTTKALFVLVTLLFFGLMILMQFSPLSILIGVATLILTTIYPLMKRKFHLSQLFLGITLNTGVLIAAAAIQQAITMREFLIYFGCIFWTLGYDTIYAFMDLKDDMKIGVKSLAILIHKKNYNAYLFVFYSVFAGSILYTLPKHNIFNLIPIGIGYIILLWQALGLDMRFTNNCMIRFKSNVIVGVLFLSAFLV